MPKKYVTQIYEVASPKEAIDLVSLGVDHVGSVLLSEEEWKQPLIKATVRAAQQEGAKSSVIPLFSRLDPLLQTAEYYRPDILHFCETLVGFGDGEIEQLIEIQQAVRSRFPGIKIMRSIPIAPAGGTDAVPTLQLARRFEKASDYLMTDTYLAESDVLGITGRTCDWGMAAKLVRESHIPVFLAGGISPENVYEALVSTNPFGVDSCTLTNAFDEGGRPIRFKKDLERVAHFLSEVRRAETR